MSKLELKGVSFKYPRGKRMIFQNVTESFASGKLTTIEGESGAGKSTLLTLLSGLALPTRGELLMDGEPVRDLTSYRRNAAAAVAQAAQEFCLAHGQSQKASVRIALCVEEMAGNTVLHGFTKDDKPHSLSIRILRKEDLWVIRFRDDCRAFDPVHYVPRAGKNALGIGLVLRLADEVRYTYSLNLNNLTILLRGQGLTAISDE